MSSEMKVKGSVPPRSDAVAAPLGRGTSLSPLSAANAALPLADAATRAPARTRPRAPAEGLTVPQPQNVAPAITDLTLPTSADQFLVVTSNVENFFTPYPDPSGRQKAEYLPTGDIGYDETAFDTHAHNLAEGLRPLNGGQGPDVLGVVEVENEQAMSRLRDHLSGLDYLPPVILPGSDRRGINLGVLTRFPVVGEPRLHPVGANREILEVTLDVGGVRTTFFMNHWPSQNTPESTRLQVGQNVRRLVEAKLQSDPNAAVVLMGDFNDDVGAASLGPKGLNVAANRQEALPSGMLLDLTAELAQFRENLGEQASSLPPGTYYWPPKDEWRTYDHLIVSPGLVSGEAGLRVVDGSTQIVADPKMRLEDGTPKRFFMHQFDPNPDGSPPPRSAIGMYPDGFSDHFPAGMVLEAQK